MAKIGRSLVCVAGDRGLADSLVAAGCEEGAQLATSVQKLLEGLFVILFSLWLSLLFVPILCLLSAAVVAACSVTYVGWLAGTY